MTHTFTVHWSDEDNEFVGTHPGYPSLSWLAPTEREALAGIRWLVACSEAERCDGINRVFYATSHEAWDEIQATLSEDND